MREKPSRNQPYKVLGRYLKTMRQKLEESLGETSGAVEIDVECLERYERGVDAPTEDILLLLISHFGMQDDEAVELWNMAGYDESNFPSDDGETGAGNEPEAMQYEPDFVSPADMPGASAGKDSRHNIVMMINLMDSRTLYTNQAELVADNNGLVINFMQSAPEASKPPVTVSRVGMSYEQAGQLMQTLQRTLLHRQYLSGPKGLPGSNHSSDTSQNS